MSSVARTFSAGLALAGFVCPFGRVAAGTSAPITLEPENTPPGYTFEMDVAMRMHHFPWLRFNMQGSGEYTPGQSYKVSFTKTPWFVPKQSQGMDLSMIDPLLWPQRYTYAPTGTHDGMTTYALHAIDDPSLRDATVSLGPQACTRIIDANYTNGTHIHMKITPAMVNGFLLPQTLSADIDEPHLPLSADAAFKNYAFNAPI
ncbi:MAG TPA: hypothetical protein VHX17_02785 [Candidatus Cybelea sp.]|jgi:hypothetical protein|nr:hypothetical protein [Candidatus Cybelea sp.]